MCDCYDLNCSFGECDFVLCASLTSPVMSVKSKVSESEVVAVGGISAGLVHFIQGSGYIGVFLGMVLESACIPLPSEVIMPFGGYLAWSGHLQLWAIIALGTLGNVLGSLLAYYVGKYGGRALIARYGRYVRISERHLQLAENWFERRGHWAVLIGRLLPGIRTFISLPAGIAKMPVAKFTLFTAIGCLPFVAALSYAGYTLGQHWDGVKHYTHPLLYAVVVLCAILIGFALLRRRKGVSNH